MSIAWTVARFEMHLFFRNPAGFVLIGLFWVVNGFFTWIYGNDILVRDEASLAAFFDVAYWSMLFFVPAWGMSALSREFQSGHWKLFRVRQVSSAQWLLGKWTAQSMIILLALLPGLLHGFSLQAAAPAMPSFWMIGLVGLWAYGSLLASLVLLAGSLTTSTIVTYLLSLLLGGFFHTLTGLVAPALGPQWRSMAEQLHIGYHLQGLWGGLLEWAQFAFFAGTVVVSLVLASFLDEKRQA